MKRRALALLAALSLVSAAPAQVTFAFNYADVVANNDTGFDDPSSGLARRDALQWAGNTLSSYFTGYAARTVTFTVNSNVTPGGSLASAGSNISGILENGFYKTNAQKMIQDNTGPGDGVINWNFHYTWDTDDSIDGSAFDFKAVAMHEILHALGFSSLVDSTERGAFDETSGDPDVWTIFDQFLSDSSGNNLVTGSFGFNTSLAGIVSNAGGASNDIFFEGANAVAIYGGLVPIYSPAVFETGSSMSHLNTNVFGTNAFVMTHAVTTGPAVRTLSALELAILTDLGYSVTAIPEPSTYAVIFGSLALVVVYRRRRAV